MSEIISTWSPLDIVLPNIDNDVDHAMYYVTDAGSIDGLNISFSVGDWLVYIKKDGVGNWYKTNGIVTFNTSSSVNNPNPGIYTRIRLDNNGNVIAADYLEADDLPAHAHVLSDIEDKDNLIELIQETVGKMLVGSEENNSVDLVYDKNTQTISAEVNLDGISIVKNKYGQIEIGEDYQASGTSGNSSGNSTGTISITNVEDLTNRLTVLENLIEKNQIIINDDSGLEERDTEGGKIVKVKVDGSSIIINAFGQLEVNPDYSLDENGNISSNCANHKHSYDQILGLEDYIVEVLNKNSTISPKDLPIDGTTIIINKDGQLAAVSTAIAQHDHVMDDIKDLNKAKADTWASDQPIKGDKTVDYTDGIIDLTSFTIGVSIEKLSEAIKSVKETAEYTKSMIGHVVPAEPNNIDYSDITYEYINEKDVINVNSLEKVKAGDSAKVYLHDVYPYNSGDIYAYIDDEQICKLHLAPNTTVDTVSNTDKLTTGILKIDSIYDSYMSITSFQGFYKSATIVFTLPENLEAGIHNIGQQYQVNRGRNIGHHIVQLDHHHGLCALGIAALGAAQSAVRGVAVNSSHLVVILLSGACAGIPEAQFFRTSHRREDSLCGGMFLRNRRFRSGHPDIPPADGLHALPESFLHLRPLAVRQEPQIRFRQIPDNGLGRLRSFRYKGSGFLPGLDRCGRFLFRLGTRARALARFMRIRFEREVWYNAAKTAI